MFREDVHDACGVALVADLQGRRRADILPLTLGALARMGHRGAVGADGRTGDGAGVMTEIPFALLASHLDGLPTFGTGNVGVGMLFVPREESEARRARKAVAAAIARHDLVAVGWRNVPVDETALGEIARACAPGIEQLFVIPRVPLDGDAFEQRLVRARRDIDAPGVYVVSLSHRTIVYKALVRSADLAAFYPDLRSREYATTFVIAHQRFSTNTYPSWTMAQPFRLLAHNGEINTIDGNRSWMRARAIAVDRVERASDSSTLDEAASLLASRGRTLPRAISALIPPAWENDPRVAGAERALLDHEASSIEPWDGPALVAFADGTVAGAVLDRNGLRPARTILTGSGLLALASEAGVFDVDESDIRQHGRIGPGGMIAIDLQRGGMIDRAELLKSAAAEAPYGEWIAAARSSMDQVRAAAALQAPFINRGKEREASPSVSVLRAFGYTRDEMQLVIAPMVDAGEEAVASMGDDTPLAILSPEPRLLFSYFKQRFAQVTNPPIDPLREGLVMSLETRLGRRGAIDPAVPPPRHVLLPDPLLKPVEVRALLSWPAEGWNARELSLLFETAEPMRIALDRLLAAAEQCVRVGATCLVLSDRGVDATHAAIPSLLAVAAVHQHLIRGGLRMDVSLIADAGDARDSHHLAALLAFGADAVCPWAARATISDDVRRAGGDVDAARRRYHAALVKGLLKILSKMGISTLRSYRGAQLFEALGLSRELIDAHFSNTPSPIGGLTIDDVAREVLARHAGAFASDVRDLADAGLYRYRRDGVPHAYEPAVVRALRTAKFDDYARLVHGRAPVVLRDLFELRRAEQPATDVEPVASIVRRFMTSAMSLGSLSPEAQEVLAVAMNRLGGRSNSGEGGALAGPAERSHRIKQVASGRFGVTAEYLVDADEIQIKIAQGSKPGEGGQLPGFKVTPLIADVRRAAARTTLISPPPHHDIYSIEDLAQLVYDLKQVNPRATVSVKLVSSAGIGTIAVGIAKAHADAIEISGHDGGTGASPLSSIRNAGTPWELGLAEAHQALVRAGLRDRVRLQVNGGLKTGRDVVIAALLGGEEFGFGTAALVSIGCAMARQCHLDTCPTGIATQRDDLRARFKGTPDDVIRFFTAIAEETRELLAMLGARTLGEIIGRSDLLAVKFAPAVIPSVARDLGEWVGALSEHLRALPHPQVPRYARHDIRADSGIDEQIIASNFRRRTFAITNADRAVGARVAGVLVREPRTIDLSFHGAAGQSFGAFAVDGMTLRLDGVANDGVGKGMSGGTIAIRNRSRRGEDVLAGNAVLYGATGGQLFVGGRCGERFAVRNSGAVAVVEGTGDHACEYMSAGTVAILGTTGANVAAGMTGGRLFLLASSESLVHGTSAVVRALSIDDEVLLRELIVAHRDATASRRAAWLLAHWKTARQRFRSVVPLLLARNERRTIEVNG